MPITGVVIIIKKKLTRIAIVIGDLKGKEFKTIIIRLTQRAISVIHYSKNNHLSQKQLILGHLKKTCLPMAFVISGLIGTKNSYSMVHVLHMSSSFF